MGQIEGGLYSNKTSGLTIFFDGGRRGSSHGFLGISNQRLPQCSAAPVKTRWRTSKAKRLLYLYCFFYLQMMSQPSRILPQSKETLLKSYTKRLKDDVKSILDNFTEIVKSSKVRIQKCTSSVLGIKERKGNDFRTALGP